MTLSLCDNCNLIFGDTFENFGDTQFEKHHPTMFKIFVSWIAFVLKCSKDSFCGFVV